MGIDELLVRRYEREKKEEGKEKKKFMTALTGTFLFGERKLFGMENLASSSALEPHSAGGASQSERLNYAVTRPRHIGCRANSEVKQVHSQRMSSMTRRSG